MDISLVRNLPRGAQITGIAAVVLFIDMLLPWYGVGGSFGAAARAFGVGNFDAWTSFSYTDLLLFVLIVVSIGWIVTLAMANPIADQLKLGVMGGGALMALIVLYRIVNQPGPNKFIDVKFGAFVGLIAVGAIVFGAVTSSDRVGPRGL